MRIGVDSYSSVIAMNKGIGSQNRLDFCDNSNNTFELHKDALFSTVNCVTGESVSVYYDNAYTEETPIMLVKGKKSDGTNYEQKVNVNDVSSEYASYVEIMALTTYMCQKGLTNDASIGINTNSCANNNIFAKQDFIAPLKQMMEWQLESKNMERYAYYAEKVKLLEKHDGKLPLYSQNKYRLYS